MGISRWTSHAAAFALGAAVVAGIWLTRPAAVASSTPCTPPPASVASNPDAARDDGGAVRRLLGEKRVKGLLFEDLNLDQVATYLRTVTGVNVFITPKVRREKFDEVKVTLGPLDDISARQALDLVTMPYDLRWEPRDGAVRIAALDE